MAEVMVYHDLLSAERNEVRQAMGALGMPPEDDNAAALAARERGATFEPIELTPAGPVDWRRRPPPRERMDGPIDKLPLKVLIIKSLKEKFTEGASSNSIREFIEKEWKRTFTAGTFSVMLTVLKDSREIYQRNRIWHLMDHHTLSTMEEMEEC
jgi:hypothetical protein